MLKVVQQPIRFAYIILKRLKRNEVTYMTVHIIVVFGPPALSFNFSPVDRKNSLNVFFVLVLQ
jgi:hypothetical protein